jgi:hypothetical protein
VTVTRSRVASRCLAIAVPGGLIDAEDLERAPARPGEREDRWPARTVKACGSAPKPLSPRWPHRCRQFSELFDDRAAAQLSLTRATCTCALQAPDGEAVDADQLAGALDIDVAVGDEITGRLVGRGVAGDQPEALGAGVQAVATEDLPDAMGLTMMPPHFSRPSSDATRLGPSPGCAIEKLTMRSSSIFGS